MAQFNFNPDEHEENKYQGLQPGEYLAAITESDLMENKNKNGTNLVLKFQVIDGPCTGQVITQNLAVKNPNPMTEKIANGNLKSLCSVLGLGQISDTVLLHNKPLIIKVGKQKKAPEYTEIKSYHPYVSQPEIKTEPKGDPVATKPWGQS